MENSRNKQFISCKWHIVLSSMMRSRAALLRPAQDVNPPFVQRIHAVCPHPWSLSSHRGYQIDGHTVKVLVFESPRFPQHRPQSAGALMLAPQARRGAMKRFRWKGVWGWKTVCVGFGTACSFRHPRGGWNVPLRIRRDFCVPGDFLNN